MNSSKKNKPKLLMLVSRFPFPLDKGDKLRAFYQIKEMSDSNRCCGFGGVTMQSEKYHLAKAAGAPKAAMIKETNAQIVSAECSACRMQITNSLQQADVDVTFKNPIELIAQTLRTK